MQKFLEDRVVLNVYAGEKLKFTGDRFVVREHIEMLLEEKLGFYVALQEAFDMDDKEYFVYFF